MFVSNLDGAPPEVIITSGSVLNTLTGTNDYKAGTLYIVTKDGIQEEEWTHA